MLLWLILLFVCTPLVELALLLRIGRTAGPLPTLGLVIVTGVLGAALARKQGITAWRRLQTEVTAGRMPGAELVDALLIFIAGVVLVTPGLITDVVGFALLVPAVRRRLRRSIADRFRERITIVGNGTTTDDTFVDVEAEDPHRGSREGMP